MVVLQLHWPSEPLGQHCVQLLMATLQMYAAGGSQHGGMGPLQNATVKLSNATVSRQIGPFALLCIQKIEQSYQSAEPEPIKQQTSQPDNQQASHLNSPIGKRLNTQITE